MTSWLVVLLAAVGPASAAPSSVDRLAEEIRSALLRVQPEAPVALVLEGAPPALTRALATVTAAKLAAVKLAPMVVEVGADAEARAVSQGARTMLRVSVAVEGQKLIVAAATTHTPSSPKERSVPLRALL